MVNKNKELKQKLEVEDYKKDSDVSVETMRNVVDSFKSYLKSLDEQELTDKDYKGNDWIIDSLEKLERKIVKNCSLTIKGEMMVVSDKGKMSSLNTTEKIVVKLIPEINYITLIRKKISELYKNENIKR